ncbi:DNA polymerase delta subunit 2-like [Tropilaelaps mercedesae]|uniref:DNA polymerase delta subunit 2-like n=1 Tax=Tropilaelaps mercedesae TaxID=418985 RepID=A0A1V9X9C9_9ACAR|nr:DNA polymerase delta subunit 2-like [Tropilaelaps mercedesae]
MAVQGDYAEKDFHRISCEFQDMSEKFRIGVKDFKAQYASLYRHRYEKCEPMLREKLQQKWGGIQCPIVEICNLECGVRSIVMGTLFKVMPKQPSILREISEDVPEDAPLGVSENGDNFTSDEDSLVLEDMRQRVSIRLSDFVNVHHVVTGIPVALLGLVDEEDAHFIMEDICFIGIQKHSPIPKTTGDKFVVFVSGLELSGSKDLTNFQLFVDYICGLIGANKDIERTAKVCRVILCGNSVLGRSNLTRSETSKFSLRKEVPDNAPWMNILDAYLAELAKSVPVDIMPGSSDPTNSLLPQQPLHHCLFPRAAVQANLTATTNPYEFEVCDPYDDLVDGVRFLGSSGQNVSDILRYSRLEGPIEALKAILKWAHLAPTVPDTLGAYPYQQKDPFIMEETPHVLFAGNQNQFAVQKFTDDDLDVDVTLVSVPTFSAKPTAVWLNLRTLDALPVDFIIDDAAEFS